MDEQSSVMTDDDKKALATIAMSNDPRVRCGAIEQLSNEDALVRIAIRADATEASVAGQRIHTSDSLARVALDSPHVDVAYWAFRRVQPDALSDQQQLVALIRAYCTRAFPQRYSDYRERSEREDLLRRLMAAVNDEQALCDIVLCCGKDFGAVARICGQSLLERLADDSESHHVRMQAIGKLEGQAVLAKIALGTPHYKRRWLSCSTSVLDPAQYQLSEERSAAANKLTDASLRDRITAELSSRMSECARLADEGREIANRMDGLA